MQTAIASQAPTVSAPPPVDESTAAPARDFICERLVEAGLVPNDFILDLNSGLGVPHDWTLPEPWNLPSRLFRFPIEVSPYEESGRRLGILHPALADHPFVKHVSQVLGLSIPPGGAPNRFGYTKAKIGTWWHAVDLVSAGRWRDALETRQFTTIPDLAHAVAFSLGCGRDDESGLTVADARHILDVLGVPPLQDPIAVLCSLSRPGPVVGEDKVERWPVNTGGLNGGELAWAYVVGLETGWFDRDRSGHLRWTRLGRDRYAAGPTATFIEQASGQGAFAF